MNLLHIAPRFAIAVSVAALTALAVIGLTRADEPTARSPATQPADQTPNPEAMRQEEARIKKFLLAMPDVVRLNPSGDVTVKHLAARYYVANVGHAKGNAWRLYLVSLLPGNPNAFTTSEIGVAAGERGLDLCLGVLVRERGKPESKADCIRVVEESLEALSVDYGIVVKRNADIPGYDKARLASDLATVIRPIWTYPSKGPRGEPVNHYVVYTYQQIAGQVFRHEFKFAERGNSVDTVRMARNVGEAKYLE